jgi:glycosyltransferase involved in cell wall biosynthesis
MEKLVSVIIPAFNADRYLAECLDSILCQSYKNLEIIITDDGSTDNTNKILDTYSHKDPRIKVIYQTNKGPAGARNNSLLHSSGEYIIFFDADDIMLPKKIIQQVEWLEKNKEYDFLFSDFIFFIDKTKKYYRHRKFLPVEENQYSDIVSRGGINPSVVCMRRKAYDEVGLFNEAQDIIGVEDLEYFLRVAKSNILIGSQVDFLTLYRFGHSNLSSKKLTMYTRASRILASQYDLDIDYKQRRAIELKIKNWNTKKRILKLKEFVVLKPLIEWSESFYHFLYYKSLNTKEVEKIIV